ncbi:ABC transporter ATP-binding protein [Flavisolibacter ginsenosidimutans]|uniref:ABC transporter ATP-binding protein n=1 Tax=Flavisolibacter ginsenosidimutans TaxID=661481 RepID=A0A5B8UMA8_9BACT|nr:ABC transporter ATP-binding protein [Flavisolibacter ginsenosidimutans]QEC57693.1 ABC transporter ATP-binding protein [Flavisolibacter ginsenosidimutans]
MNRSTFFTFRRIWLQARPFWGQIVLLFFLSLLATPIALLKPYAVKLVIDSAFGHEPLPVFIRFFFAEGYKFSFTAIIFAAAALVIITALAENLLMLVNWVLTTYTGEKLVLHFRTRLFNHLQRLSLAYHDTAGTSDSLYRLQWDTTGIRTLLLGNVAPLFSSFLTLFAMVGVIFFINVPLAIIAVSVIPPLFLLIRYSSSKLKKNWEQVKDKESRALSVLQEVLTSLRVVKAFGQEDGEEERFVRQSDTAVKEQIKVAWMAASFYLIVGLVFAIATALFIYLGARYVQQGKMTLGELTLMLAYLTQFFAPLQNISKIITDIQASMASIERVYALLDKEKEVKETSHAAHLLTAKGSFRFQQVSFGYAPQKQTLSGLSFEIRPGDRVGIMGSTGSGKSTLIGLLMRFYDPALGQIVLDGKDIRDYKLVDYRKQFSLVLQEPVLFSTSIYENIKYGKPEATETEIVEAAKAANAHEFILRCKEGYHTLVGERGMQLSGGERQRISIARAFIKNAPVLILDEPTSSLDVKTEAQIMEAMERLMKGRTTFMITHRLDTLKSCNVVLHLEKGQLVEAVRDGGSDFVEEKKKEFAFSA